jgi:murein DD-endopeptidase MepM/ murein hydrolase activator NlpD
MKLALRQLLLAACGVLLLGGASTPSPLPRRAQAVLEEAPSAAVLKLSDGRAWLSATRAALNDAAEIPVPYAELGELAVPEAVAAAFAFDAMGGQMLELTLERDPSAEERIYVDVFRVVDVLGQSLHQRLTALRPNATSLRARLPSDGTYHVLLQAGASGAGRYSLTLELGAALPFPVVGAEADAIRSRFGASRDAGRRHHEGVDIFVQRLTPVLAVAAGRAMPRQDALGGNTVWLNTPGRSYYYAHLDRVAVRDQQRVKAGDVLGYVGNTGNATGMASHLHFGVYRWGRDPVDPLPLLVGQRFDETPAELAAGAGG